MAHKQWAGRAVANARAIVATWLPTTCPRCGQPVTPDQPWNVDHIPGRDQLHPTEWFNPAYWHASHRHCDAQAGARYGNRKRAAQKRANQTKRRQAADIATHTPAAPHLIHQISGPPCAGKSTWITQHAQPGDLVLDDNQLAQQHGGRDRIPQHAWAQWRHDRATHITTWTGPGRLWFTQGDPAPHSPGIHVHLIDPGPTECHARADRDGRPAATHDWINTWYAKHGDSSGEDGSPTHEAPFLGAARQSLLAPTTKKSGITLQVSGNGIGLPEYHPDGFPLPRISPQLPPDADLGLGRDVADWIDATVPGPPLMPWQRLVLEFALASVPDRLSPGGRKLLFSTVVLRLARQQGKTYMARRFLLWRLMQGEALFGQPQRIINTHPDATQAKNLMEPVARQLGYGQGGKKGLIAQTFMAIWYPGGVEDDHAAAWFARAMTTHALTGNQGITCSYVDEMQDARKTQVQEALGGSLSGARVVQPQRWFTGTGEKPGSDLLRGMRGRIGRRGMCWLEWSTPPGTNVRDEKGWRWASPDWSDGRGEYLAELCDEMLSSEFAANYLLSDEALSVPGLVDEGVWRGLLHEGAVAAAGVGVEAAPGGVPVVAVAGREGGRVVVGVRQAASMAQAAQWCREAGVAPRVGKSLLHDPVWGDVGAVGVSGTSPAAVGVFLQLVADDVLRHDGGEVLTGQVLGTSAVPGAAGLRLSGGRTDAIKAAVWAVEDARAGAQDWFSF